MKNLFIALVLTLSIPFLGYSQIKVKGTIKDEANSSIPYANILALNPIDSGLITGIFTPDGKFEITVNQAEIILRITALGYKHQDFKVNHSQDLGTITLKLNELSEIEIVHVNTLFSSNDGNTVVNVSNTMLANSGSIQEIISKSPGLEISGNEIVVQGKGNAIIYIDGQRVSVESFKAIPVSQIKSIEIIKNPDAAYDAQGEAIIKITLLDLGLEGTKGSFLNHYTRGFYDLYYTDLSISLKRKKVSLNTAFNTNIGATGGKGNYRYDINSCLNPYLATNNYKEKTYLRNVSNYLIGAKYVFNSKNSLSAQYNGNYSLFDLDVYNDRNQHYKQNDSIVSIYSNDIAITRDRLNSGSINYYYNIDTLGSNLFAALTFNQLNNLYNDTIIEKIKYNESETKIFSRSNGETSSQILAGQIDYIKKIKSGGTLKSGAKLSSSLSESSVFVRNTKGLNSVVKQDDNYLYLEDLISAYCSYSRNIGASRYQVGSRMEHTQSNAKNNGISYLDTSYFSFFPNAFFSYKLGKIEMKESFSSRIQRPRYADITPYTYYFNSFASVKGNPSLIPSFVYSFEHKMVYRGIDISLGASSTANPRAFITTTDSISGANVFKAVNFDKLNKAYVELGYAYEKGFWSTYNQLNLSLSKFIDHKFDISKVGTTPALYLYSYNKVNVKSLFLLEITGSYTHKHQNGRSFNLSSGNLDVSFSKAFLDNKWNLQIGVYDIFRTSRRRQINIIGNDSAGIDYLEDSRYFRVSVTRSFGKLKESDYDHSNIGENEIQRAK